MGPWTIIGTLTRDVIINGLQNYRDNTMLKQPANQRQRNPHHAIHSYHTALLIEIIFRILSYVSK